VLKPEVAAEFLIDKFQSKHPSIMEVRRGILSKGNVKLPHKTISATEDMPVDDRAKELQMVP
jgi:hypothetical protein